jgi:hypothetical protein
MKTVHQRRRQRISPLGGKRRRIVGKSNMQVCIEAREQLKNIHSNTEVIKQIANQADLHTIFGIGGILTLVIEYADARDIHLFFDQICTEYSSMLLGQDRIRPIPRQALARSWTPRCHEMMQGEIRMRWVRHDYHQKAPFPFNMFCFIIFKVMQRNWVELFLRARNLCDDEPGSERAFFSIMQLICQTQHLAAWPESHQVLATIPQFNIILRVINTPSPRAECYPTHKTEVSTIIHQIYAEHEFRTGDLSRFLNLRLPMILHKLLRTKANCPSWGLLREAAHTIQVSADEYFETAYLRELGINDMSAYYSKIIGERMDSDPAASYYPNGPF